MMTNEGFLLMKEVGCSTSDAAAVEHSDSLVTKKITKSEI